MNSHGTMYNVYSKHIAGVKANDKSEKKKTNERATHFSTSQTTHINEHRKQSTLFESENDTFYSH